MMQTTNQNGVHARPTTNVFSDPMYAKVLLHSFYMAISSNVIMFVDWLPFCIMPLPDALKNGVHLCCFWLLYPFGLTR